MPIYEYYCPDNHTVYQFFAKTLAQGRTIPKCPDNPKFKMQKAVSAFAVTSGGKSEGKDQPAADVDTAEDARMEAAMSEMEREFSSVDENDPKAMGRMMRRMAEMTGEKIDGEMEEVVRKLEEGADPESLDESLGGDLAESDDVTGPAAAYDEPKKKRHRYQAPKGPARRDPILYDYS